MTHQISTATSRLRRLTPALAVLAVTGTAAYAAPAAADASTPAQTTTSKVTTASLLTVEDVAEAGLDADTATATRTGDAQLNDAGRYDEGCLHDKTIRAITGAKAYPAKGTGQGYADVTITSTRDKEVYVTESVAQGRTNKDTDRYVATLKSQIVHVQDCQQDPAQGIRYGEPHHLTSGSARADYYPVVLPDGSRDGGGVAVVRDGTRFGIVSMSSGENDSATTLSEISLSAAQQLH